MTPSPIDHRMKRRMIGGIVVAIVLSLGGLGFGVVLQVERNADRTAAAVASCQRGNALRSALTDFMVSVEKVRLTPDLQDAAKKFTKQAKPVDCVAVTPGASPSDLRPTTTTTTQEPTP